MPHARRLVPALVAALLVSGCDDPVSGPVGAEPPPPGQQASTTAPQTLSKVSEHDNARYADIAVGPDGTLHAVFQDTTAAKGASHIFYRHSSDGGATWGPLRQLSEQPSSTSVGLCRVAVDASGRVYAIWKTDTYMADTASGEANEGTLVYRTLEAGDWSPLTTVSAEKMAVSWFPATAPDGSVHLVWNERFAGEAGWPSPSYQAGVVKQARLEGTRHTAATIHETPAIPVEGSTTVIHHDGLSALRGYVDEAGVAHFVAVRIPGGDRSEPTEIVHFDGTRLTPLFDLKAFRPLGGHFQDNPPTLLRDAAGVEHLIIQNDATDPPAVLDYSPATAAQPQIVAMGAVRGFQAYQGPKGRLAVLTSVNVEGDPTGMPDLWASVHDGKAWSSGANVTRNAERAEGFSKNTSANVTMSRYSTYSSRFASGAFDAQGRLNLLLVNSELVHVMGEDDSWLGGNTNFAGAAADTNVFFSRL